MAAELEFEENLHVSEHYVAWWGMEEALREFYQNWRDATFNYLSKTYTDFSLKKVKYVAIDNKDMAYQANQDNPATSFCLLYDGKKVSFIRYFKGELTFTNPGTFSMRCFILGGSDAAKHSKSNNITLGKFGEGMKLAALAILRKDKEKTGPDTSISISSGESYYNFFLKRDPRFDETCLFFHRLNRSEMETGYDADTVSVKISGMDKERWINLQKRFLDISPVPFDAVTTPEVEHVGRLLLSPEYRSCMYLKGVYVCHDPYSRQFPYGIDLLEGELDRDRLLFKVEAELIKKFDIVTGAVLSARATNAIEFEPRLVPRIERMFSKLVEPQVVNWGTARTLYQKVNKEASYRLLCEWRKQKKDETLLPASSHDGVQQRELALKLPQYFHFVDHYLFLCLKTCQGHFEDAYKPPTKWVDERLEVDETVELGADLVKEAEKFFPGGLVVKKWDWHIMVKKGEKHYLPSVLVEGGELHTLVWRAMAGSYQIVNI